MGVRTWLTVAALTTGALGFAYACKSTTSSCSGGTPPSLVGTYALESYTLNTTTLTAPTVSGTLRFYTSRYAAVINVPNGTGGTTVETDSGSYTIMGASCIEQSSVLGQPQFSGTFTYSAADSTLAVTGAAGGQAVASVWKKTS